METTENERRKREEGKRIKSAVDKRSGGNRREMEAWR